MSEMPDERAAEVHCATCDCVPGMTPAIRFDTTPAERDGVVRDHCQYPPGPDAEAQPGEWVQVRRSDLLEWAQDWQVDHGTGDGNIVTPFDGYLLCTPKLEGVEGLPAKWRAEADEIAANNWACNSNSIRARADELENALAQQPVATVSWRDAFIAERARRYRSEGMKIEQARIHAETDATLMELTVSQQPAADPLEEWANRPLIYTATVGKFVDGVVVQQPAVRRQYFYKVRTCQADGSREPDCICWHDEGTGPLSDGTAKTWRDVPTQQPTAVDGVWLNRAQKLYSRCALWPEKSADGRQALLELRNHVFNLLEDQQGGHRDG